MSSMPDFDPAHSCGPNSPHGPAGQQIVVGVDTHADVHVAAVVTTLGAQLATATFPTTTAGYRQLLAWAPQFRRPGPRRGGGHRLLRRRFEPLPASQWPDRDRGQPPRQGAPPTARQDLHRRCRRSGPRRAVATGHHRREDRRWTNRDAAPVPPGPGIGGKSRTEAINQLDAVIVTAGRSYAISGPP
jgi:transposase